MGLWIRVQLRYRYRDWWTSRCCPRKVFLRRESRYRYQDWWIRRYFPRKVFLRRLQQKFRLYFLRRNGFCEFFLHSYLCGFRWMASCWWLLVTSWGGIEIVSDHAIRFASRSLNSCDEFLRVRCGACTIVRLILCWRTWSTRLFPNCSRSASSVASPALLVAAWPPHEMRTSTQLYTYHAFIWVIY